jgi:hypothetical protein
LLAGVSSRDAADFVCCCRGCPKVYHPPCIKRDESFFNSRSKWNCGELIQCTNSSPYGYVSSHGVVTATDLFVG